MCFITHSLGSVDLLFSIRNVLLLDADSTFISQDQSYVNQAPRTKLLMNNEIHDCQVD